MFDASYPKGHPYYWTSSYLDAFSADAIEQAVHWSAAAPSPALVVAFWQLVGAIAGEAGDRGAYGNREASFLLGIEANGRDRGTCRPDDVEWACACRAAFAPFASSDAVYANLPGDQTQAAVHRQADEDARARREAVVARIDPHRLFAASR